MRWLSFLMFALPAICAPKSPATTTKTPKPAFCTAVSEIVSALSLQPSATPFCQSFLSLGMVTSTTTVTTITPTITAPTMTTTNSTVVSTSTDVVVVTSIVTIEDILLNRRSAAKKTSTSPIATPGALTGRASTIVSKACVCLNVPPPTTTVSAISTADSATVTPIVFVTASSETIATSTSTTVTTVYTETCAAAAFTCPVINGGFETSDLSPWSQYGDSDYSSSQLVSPGSASNYALQVVMTPPPRGIASYEIYQNLTLCPGVFYTLSYQYRFEIDNGYSSDISAFVGNLGYVSMSSYGSLGQWNNASCLIYAVSSSMSLHISFNSYYKQETMSIDNIVLKASV